MYILCAGDQAFVPRAKKNFFYKFWRTVELDLLKQDSIDSNKLWKAAGKTRSETIFTRRQSSRLLYRKRLRNEYVLDMDSVNFHRESGNRLDG